MTKFINKNSKSTGRTSANKSDNVEFFQFFDQFPYKFIIYDVI